MFAAVCFGLGSFSHSSRVDGRFVLWRFSRQKAGGGYGGLSFRLVLVEQEQMKTFVLVLLACLCLMGFQV